MSECRADRIERMVDIAAAGSCAAALACCALLLSTAMAGVAAAVLGFCCSLALLRAVRPEDRRFEIAELALPPIPLTPEVLLLTHASAVAKSAPTQQQQQQQPQQSPEACELLLEDVLAQIGSDSRVVRLFDSAAMPSPGELRARIDRHLDTRRVSAAPPDASEALREALAELRRSIR
jgi:hypothetical protein